MSDSEIIQGCLNENRRAQEFLYKKYSSRVSNICSKYFSNHQDAEDASQETFIKIFKYLKNFRGDGSFEGWISIIAKNTSIKKITRLKSREEMLQKNKEILTQEHSDPSIIEDLSIKDIVSTIEKLPKGYKIIFQLHSLGYSHTEISQMLNIKSGTSRSQLAKARRTILKNLN
jgi:RNA polymerase sigma-70 factor (ECF subfamily)